VIGSPQCCEREVSPERRACLQQWSRLNGFGGRAVSEKDGVAIDCASSVEALMMLQLAVGLTA
jgi:hypothetical protein